MVVFNVIRVHIVYVTIKVGVAKHSWTSWPHPLLLCPYEAFSKVGDYVFVPSMHAWYVYTKLATVKALVVFLLKCLLLFLLHVT